MFDCGVTKYAFAAHLQESGYDTDCTMGNTSNHASAFSCSAYSLVMFYLQVSFTVYIPSRNDYLQMSTDITDGISSELLFNVIDWMQQRPNNRFWILDFSTLLVTKAGGLNCFVHFIL